MKKGMIKLSVMYANEEGKRFDLDYYENSHIPLVGRLVGDAIKAANVEKGIGSAVPGSPAPYVAVGTLYFDTIEDFQTNFGPNAPEIMADIPNFTDITPTVQISTITM